MKQSSAVFALEGKFFSIPVDYLKAKSLPDDPPGSIVFEKDTQDSTNILMFFFIERSEALPFDDNEGLIASLHHCLGDNQGIIAVNTCKTKAGVPVVYTIVKNLKKTSGVQYMRKSCPERRKPWRSSSMRAIPAAYTRASCGRSANSAAKCLTDTAFSSGSQRTGDSLSPSSDGTETHIWPL